MIEKRQVTKMKVKMKDALDIHNILSHVFLECTPNKVLEKIAAEKRKLPPEEQADFTFDLKVTINGHNVDPKRFFNIIKDQWEKLVQEEATNIVRTQIGDKFNDIVNKLQDTEQVIDGWVGEINWEVTNPFIKSHE